MKIFSLSDEFILSREIPIGDLLSLHQHLLKGLLGLNGIIIF